jgi:hypothetical protein
MDKAQRIEAMRRLLPRNSKAQTVRGIARWLKGCGRERYALNGYARVESRDAYHQARKGKRKDWYAAQSRRRYDARYMRLGALTCDALGHVARDTQQELIAAGVSTRAVKALGRLGVDRRAARIAAWLSAPARAVAATMSAFGTQAYAAAESLHTIQSQYSSSRASWVFGLSATEEADWNAYGKRYGHPAKWKNPAYSVDVQAIPGGYDVRARVCSARDKVTYVPMPRGADFAHRARLASDVYCIVTGADTVDRYDVRGRKTGVALLIGGAWEHGAERADCEREHARKAEIAARQALEAAQTRRQDRRERLFSRLASVPVVADMIRAEGACMAGIQSWCSARGVDPAASVPLRVLAHDAAAAGYALKVARRVLAGVAEGR